MANSLRAQGFLEVLLMGDSGGNGRGMTAVAQELARAWSGTPARIYHIPEYYDYNAVWAFQRDVLGVDENPDLDGIHDDYYITSIIMNEDPEHVRFEQRLKAGLAMINGISLSPLQKTIDHGRRLIEFRTDLAVAGVEKARAGRQ